MNEETKQLIIVIVGILALITLIAVIAICGKIFSNKFYLQVCQNAPEPVVCIKTLKD